jgi:hypothetical protein
MIMFSDLFDWFGGLVVLTIFLAGTIIVILILISWMNGSILDNTRVFIYNLMDSIRIFISQIV